MNFSSDKQSVDVNGVATRYFDHGRGESVMLLLHNGLFSKDSFCADAVVWEHNMQNLGESFRVIALDMLGQGGTDLPTNEDDYSYDGMVNHTLAFLKALGVERAHLVGHDEGAMVAIRIAIKAPESVLSCTLVNSPAVAPGGDYVPNLTISGPLQPVYGRDSQAWVLGRQSFTPHHVTTGRLLDAATANATSEKFGRLRAKLNEKSMQLRLIRSITRTKVDTFVHLRENGLKVPVLLLWGTEDPMSASNYVTQWGASTDSNSAIGHARALFNLIQSMQPMTRMSFIGRTGYMPFREQPDVFNQIVGGFARAVDAKSRGQQLH
jgi:pimeloyl-ACP methyl ester carboxylesterase